MTCIAAVTDGKTVWMGGDSGTFFGWDVTVQPQGKIFRTGEFVMGASGLTRLAQLLRYRFSPPKMTEGENLDSYMATTFVDSLRSCLKDSGCAELEKSYTESTDGSFLVGFRGRLFRVTSNYAFAEDACGYDAIGCGGDFAKGVLFALGPPTSDLPADQLIRRALECAERHSGGVRGPFTILSTADPT